MANSAASTLAKSKAARNNISQSAASIAAHELGSLGGQSGGPARAAILESKQLRAIAKHAANRRWQKDCDKGCPYC